MMKLLQVSICMAFALVGGSYRPGNRRTDWGDRKAVVPYFFAAGIPEADKHVVRNEMQRITHYVPCITFNETSMGGVPAHHLEIVVGNDLGCFIDFKGRMLENFNGNVYADGQYGDPSTYELFPLGDKVLLKSKYRLANLPWCANSEVVKSGVLHELMHVLGIQHTQTRSDRDNYLKVNSEDCVKPDKYSQEQYDMFKREKLENYGVPYKCNSIMHYRDNELARNDFCKTMVAKTADCNATGFGSFVAIEEDWQLLREAHCKR